MSEMPMSSVREAILAQNRLARMRQGQLAPDMIDLPSLEGIRVAQVPLTEAETQQGIIAAARLDVGENLAGMQARNRMAQQYDAWLSLREPGNLTELLFKSVEEMTANLDPKDLDYVSDNLGILMDYASPALEGVTEKDLDDLKKGLAALDWSVLTGRQWAALKLALRILLPARLAARSSGSSSTESSTERSDEPEST